ncbi:MAG TPA: GAF domain-containing protein [Nitrospiraceae bacterium]|nr:GAF domain-containing protein [Nitrospiraceae bacterium]
MASCRHRQNDRKDLLLARGEAKAQRIISLQAEPQRLCSLLSVPMMVRDKALGVINSYTSAPHVFTSEEVKLLQAIANQAAIAIEHTTLIEKSHEMQEAMAVRRLIQRQSMDFRK